MNTMTTRERYSTDLLTSVRDTTTHLYHDVLTGPPCEWSAAQGATHTLVVESAVPHIIGDSRPAKMLKTVLYVGADEDEEGRIVWERWNIQHRYTCQPREATPPKGIN
jgi:hypothetical protein